jgi:hypothetical protein
LGAVFMWPAQRAACRRQARITNEVPVWLAKKKGKGWEP